MREEITEETFARLVAGVHFRQLRRHHRGQVVLPPDLVVVGLEATIETLTLGDDLPVGVLVTTVSQDFIGLVGIERIHGLLGIRTVIIEVIGTLQEDLQTLDKRRIIVDIQRVGKGTAALVRIIQVVIHHRDRVFGRGLALIRVVIRVVLDGGRGESVGEGDVVEDHVGLLVVAVVVRRIGGSGGTERSLIIHGQIVGKFERKVTAQGIALIPEIVRGIIDTAVVVEAAGKEIRQRFIAAADRQVVRLRGGVVLHRCIPPAEIGQRTVLGSLDVFVAERTVELRHVRHFIGHLDIISDAHFLRHFRTAEREYIGIGNGRFLHGRTLLGGHHDDAVAGTQAIDGCRSILQHGNAFDIFRVELRELKVRIDTLVGVGITVRADHAVDHDQRGAITAQADIGAEGTGRTAGLTDQQAGHLTLKGGDDIVLLGLGHILRTHRGDGAGQGFLFLGTVTDKHRFFKHLSILDKDDVNGRAITDGHLLGGAADKRDDQDRLRVDVVDRRVTVQIGGLTIGSSLDHDRSTGHGTIGIHNVHFHRHVLSTQLDRTDQRERHRKCKKQ